MSLIMVTKWVNVNSIIILVGICFEGMQVKVFCIHFRSWLRGDPKMTSASLGVGGGPRGSDQDVTKGRGGLEILTSVKQSIVFYRYSHSIPK